MNVKRKQCPICKLDNQEISVAPAGGDEITYKCMRCGSYSIAGTAESMAENNSKSAQLSGWLRERSIWGLDIPMLTSSFLNKVVDTLPTFSPREKQNKLLRAIEQLTDHPGRPVTLTPKEDASLAWAENENEFRYYIKSLIDRELLELVNDSNHTKRSLLDLIYPIIITASGWDYLEKNQLTLTSKTQAFVAMSFDNELLSAYTNAIKPAIELTGYSPCRVDAEPHIERIDTKIIAEIKNSRFLVADVTQQRAGVYYEAGFAQGMNIPVIWCVRHDDIDNIHFDTRQYHHIVWETEDKLKEDLINSILATIGRFASTSF